MKRKDWKIKNLKKDIFGNYKNNFKIINKFYFLRKLYLSKNYSFFKMKKISNFIFFYSKNIKLKKNIIKNVNYICKILPYKNYYIPTSIFRKKIFRDNDNKNFLEKNNLLFIKNKNYHLKGNNFILIDKKKNYINIENENFIIKKIEFDFNNILKNNNFINYNISILNSIELYKIFLYLYISKTLK